MATRHHLVWPGTGVRQVAGDMAGLHSSDPATVYLSARARIPGLKKDDVEAALYDERSVVRMLAMRRTMFVVPIDLAPILHYSSTVALMAPERKRLVDMVEKAGFAKDGHAWVREVSERTMDALRARGEAVATELTQDVPELDQKITFYKKDGSVLTTVGMSTRVLFLLAAAERGDADHRDVARGRVGAQALHHLVAIHAGHHHVEQDQIGLRAHARQVQRSGAGVGRAHGVLVAQQLTEHGEVLGHIVDNKHGRLWHRFDLRTGRFASFPPRRGTCRSRACP